MPKHKRRHQSTKRLKCSGKPRETVNKPRTEQIRKNLRKHYANKYRVR